jgi:diguanylate cyclase (GGDEF)-like protein
METKNAHILIVDDEKLNIELAAVYLKQEGYKISYTTQGIKAIELVESKGVDLILLDINMPEVDGFSVAKALKRDSKTKDIPIIFLTAQSDIEYVSKAFEIGGVDYITKPFNGLELKARVKTHLNNVFYLQEIKEKQSKLAQLSITDPLTKLYNSLYFDTQIKQRSTQGEHYWILYIKINRFDVINTLYGFSKANKILEQFAKELKKAIPNNATAARLYGVGFGVILNDYSQEYMQKLYISLNDQLKKKEEELGIKDYSVVFSHIENLSSSLEVIYKKINKALYEIQNKGEKYIFLSLD